MVLQFARVSYCLRDAIILTIKKEISITVFRKVEFKIKKKINQGQKIFNHISFQMELGPTNHILTWKRGRKTLLILSIFTIGCNDYEIIIRRYYRMT